MPVVYACIQPASRIGEEEAPRLATAFSAVGKELESYAPELLVIINAPRMLLPVIALSGDETLARRVEAEAKKDALPVSVSRGRHDTLDLLKDAVGPPDWLVVAAARLNLRSHFEFGRALGRVLDGVERRIAIACVADVSKTRDARAGRAFDEHYRRAIENWDVKWLVGLDAETRRRGGESSAPATAVLMGALGGYRIQPRVLSYEVAGDAGMLVAAIDVLGPRRG